MRIRNPNGSGTLEVTKGAYREIYAHLGWVPDAEPKKTILANGGVYEREVPVDGIFIKRYWIQL